MKKNENIDKAIDALKNKLIPAGPPKEVIDATLKKLSEIDDSFEATVPKRIKIIERIKAMKSFTKLAIAATIIIAALVGINHFGGSIDMASVAWASVAEKMEQVHTYIYQMKMDTKGVQGSPDGKFEATIYGSSQYGMRTDVYVGTELVQQTYVDLIDGSIINVMPKNRQYLRMGLTEKLLNEMKEESGDPKKMIKEFMELEYTELGRKIINGIEAAGIETNDPKIGGGMFDNAFGRIWVDVKTELPILIELELSTNNDSMEMKVVMDKFEWGVPLDASEFEPNIPDDYKLLADVEIPEMDVQQFTKGLGIFADFTDGRYPSSLTSMTAMQEVEAVIGKKLMSDPNYKPGTPPDKKIIEDAMSVQMVCMLYAGLIKDGNEPAYYGNKVTTEFPDAVLLRWKIADEQYVVIFGDLTSEIVTADRLAELEAMPLNTNLFPIKPQPVDGATGAGIDELQLSWMPGMDSIAQQIYFGEDINALALLDEVAEPCYTELPTLKKAAIYYWRVDQLQTNGSIVTGDVWSFETGKLIVLWTMDENDGNTISDSSGNELHGTIKGDPQQTQGCIDGALKFDGNGDYVSIANHPDFDITDAITVMCWIKVDKFDKDWQAIVAKGDNTWRLARNIEDGIQFACNGASNNYWGCINGKININDSQWHHIAGVYGGSKICLYIDGNLDVSEKASGEMVTDEFDVYIGENAECQGRFWNGLIDDVRIYSYPLSQSEITAICQNQQPVLVE